MVGSTALRAAFARRLSAMYGTEVPAYNTLVDVAHEVNREVMARMGAGAERLGSIGRVTAERHGAIRVGTPAELAQVARIFGAMGMHPVGYYDLREAAGSSVPVVSTAFRPVDEAELAANPFRMFTSLLVSDDRRFFNAELQARIDAQLVKLRKSSTIPGDAKAELAVDEVKTMFKVDSVDKLRQLIVKFSIEFNRRVRLLESFRAAQVVDKRTQKQYFQSAR